MSTAIALFIRILFLFLFIFILFCWFFFFAVLSNIYFAKLQSTISFIFTTSMSTYVLEYRWYIMICNIMWTFFVWMRNTVKSHSRKYSLFSPLFKTRLNLIHKDRSWTCCKCNRYVLKLEQWTPRLSTLTILFGKSSRGGILLSQFKKLSTINTTLFWLYYIYYVPLKTINWHWI